jgi:hypothetical protein
MQNNLEFIRFLDETYSFLITVLLKSFHNYGKNVYFLPFRK